MKKDINAIYIYPHTFNHILKDSYIKMMRLATLGGIPLRNAQTPMGLKKSHWRELNTRPTPYQGVAIPLSHSGSEADDR